MRFSDFTLGIRAQRNSNRWHKKPRGSAGVCVGCLLFYRRFYDKDGDIGNLYYKVVSRIRRRNRKVQTPISPLIIFSITLLRTFCNSLFKLFFKFFKVILYCNKICGVPSNLRFSRYSTPPTVHRPGGRAQLWYLYFNKINAHSQMGFLPCCNTDIL